MMDVFVRLLAVLLLGWIVSGCADQSREAEPRPSATNAAPSESDGGEFPGDGGVAAMEADAEEAGPPEPQFDDEFLMEEFAMEEMVVEEMTVEEIGEEPTRRKMVVEEMVLEEPQPAPPAGGSGPPSDEPGGDSDEDEFDLADADYVLQKIYYGTDRAPEVT